MPGVAVCAGVVAEEAGLFMVCLGTHWGLPPVLFAFWHWRFGPVEGRGVQRSGRGRSRVSAANVCGGAGPSLWARSAAEAVALRGADRRPQSEGQKGRTTGKARGVCRVRAASGTAVPSPRLESSWCECGKSLQIRGAPRL